MARLAVLLLVLPLSACCVPTPWSCTEACTARGECSLRTERAGDGLYRCYAATNAQCAASEACRTRGACKVAEDGTCVRPGDVASRRCAVSRQCKVWGGCNPRDGFCEARSAADCQQSLECIGAGRCTLHAGSGLCHVGSEADCKGSTGCALNGLCAVVPSPFGLGFDRCGLRDDPTACAATIDCAREGRCVPTDLVGCTEGCRVQYCALPDTRSTPPCTHATGGAIDACSPDGMCLRDAQDRCVHVDPGGFPDR